MTGSRGWKGGDECDCLSNSYRRLVRFRPGVVRAAKRKFWKRDDERLSMSRLTQIVIVLLVIIVAAYFLSGGNVGGSP